MLCPAAGQNRKEKNRREQHPDKHSLNTVATSRSWRGFPAIPPGVLPAAGVSMPATPCCVKPFVPGCRNSPHVSQRYGARGFTILDLRFTNRKLAAYADRAANECLLPMVRWVIPHYDFFTQNTMPLCRLGLFFHNLWDTCGNSHTCPKDMEHEDLRFLDLRLTN